ncbi:N-6 DNA methylase [Chelatococcus sambhunathii]|uniref:site-specific DNA-methyltransferase (adenine-specific) n=1 Tax=Chelatococcus sambhunathii TaxID=363953 RepID=A0ABU1DH79_9HYPH|nr:N-6 DNA methylase [Chelatococcus sambhunathii]MDR4307478.1 N-6 DNA methylase [Chelatococcus sambhunathii]
MAADFESYFRRLAASALDEKTEHSDRDSLKALLEQAADDAEPGGRVLHEPRRDRSGAGSPDYKITRGGRIAGYVEVKAIDENLSKILKSEQIKKYRTLSDNLLLTDYLEFIWMTPSGDVRRERLAYSEDLLAKKLALRPERVEAVRGLLRGFFSATPSRIARAEDLALALARRAALLRDFLSEELQRQTKEHREGRLHALFDVFRKQVFHELSVGDFADAFAQMLAYGLFLARLNAGEREAVTLDNVRQHIPGSFALIRELVRFLEEMNEPEYREVRWVIDEVLSIVNGLDLDAIHRDLSFRARKAISRKVRAVNEEEHRLFEKDPFIYFYEDFLKAYDPKMRKSRGVYYTPPPVVNFIIRAIDDILKDTFGIERGLADHEKVTVLDFACGTGTFLLEAFEKIFETIGGPDAGQADQIVREHLT